MLNRQMKIEIYAPIESSLFSAIDSEPEDSDEMVESRIDPRSWDVPDLGQPDDEDSPIRLGVESWSEDSAIEEEEDVPGIDPVSQYFHEMGLTPLLNRGEEISLFQRLDRDKARQRKLLALIPGSLRIWKELVLDLGNHGAMDFFDIKSEYEPCQQALRQKKVFTSWLRKVNSLLGRMEQCPHALDKRLPLQQRWQDEATRLWMEYLPAQAIQERVIQKYRDFYHQAEPVFHVMEKVRKEKKKGKNSAKAEAQDQLFRESERVL